MGLDISLRIYLDSESIEIGARLIGDVLTDTIKLVYIPYTPSITPTHIFHIRVFHIYMTITDSRWY